MRLPPAIHLLLTSIVAAIVNRQFDALEVRGLLKRVSAMELQEALDDYGGKFVEPPESAWRKVDVYVRERHLEWSFDINLWTEEEGRSELVLQVQVNKTPSGALEATIEDLLVL